MVQTNIRMSVPPEKLKEVLQTFQAIVGPIRRERGCISCHCYLDIEVENTICFVEEWQGGADLEAHLRSVHFGVLAGAMKLLTEEPVICFHSIASSAGTEAITAALAHKMVPDYYQSPASRTSTPSPLMGEGWREGDKLAGASPSHQGRGRRSAGD